MERFALWNSVFCFNALKQWTRGWRDGLAVRSFPCKHDALSLSPRTWWKLGVVACTCNSSAGEVEMKGFWGLLARMPLSQNSRQKGWTGGSVVKSTSCSFARSQHAFWRAHNWAKLHLHGKWCSLLACLCTSHTHMVCMCVCAHTFVTTNYVSFVYMSVLPACMCV